MLLIFVFISGFIMGSTMAYDYLDNKYEKELDKRIDQELRDEHEKGKPLSEAQKAQLKRLHESTKGSKRTIEQRKRMSEAARKRCYVKTNNK